eukprot:1871059-Prymnesium_polylepis.1
MAFARCLVGCRPREACIPGGPPDCPGTPGLSPRNVPLPACVGCAFRLKAGGCSRVNGSFNIRTRQGGSGRLGH